MIQKGKEEDPGESRPKLFSGLDVTGLINLLLECEQDTPADGLIGECIPSNGVDKSARREPLCRFTS